MTIRTRLLLVAGVPAVALAATVVLLRSGAPSGTAMVATLLAACGAVAAIVLATAVAGTITSPMRRLGEAAERASNLPQLVEALRKPGAGDQALALTPVGLPAGDEIGDVARSFDAFQGAAARLAVSQAALLNKTVAEKGTVEVFVNLARRMQGLVDHQIEFLDGLEAEEQDPDTLENLFQLDQLATRVRRNAESLLTLAGAAAARSWERPLAMSDVIRAGMAEVEDIGRVDLVMDDNAAMLGNVAADAAHLLSELLENATRWSPPETRVEVIGRPAAGGYAITIEDRGIGMAADALAEANHILTGPPLAEATVARSLGLVVTGRLARRLGIVVRLGGGAGGGIMAKVLIPPDLMVAAEGAALEEVAAGPRTLPFALARQEKRARISSQRSRGRRSQAAEAEPVEATITSLPTSRWADEEPQAPAEPVSRWADALEVIEPAAPVEPVDLDRGWTPAVEPAWTPAAEEWTPTASDWPSSWPEPETVVSSDEPAWTELPVAEPAPVEMDEPFAVDEVVAVEEAEQVEEAEIAVEPPVALLPGWDVLPAPPPAPQPLEPPAAAPPALVMPQWEPAAPPAPASTPPPAHVATPPPAHVAAPPPAPVAAPPPAEPVRPPAPAAWEPTAPVRPTPLPSREAGEQRPMPPRRIEWPTAVPSPAPPAPVVTPTPVVPPAPAAAATPPPPPPTPPVVEPPAAEVPVPEVAPRPTPMVRPARFSAAPSRPLAGDMPSRAPLPAPDTKEDEYRRHLERATAAGLVRRVPKASLPKDTGGAGVRTPKTGGGQPVAERLPDEVRSLLSNYRSGVQRGRADGPSDDQRTTEPQE